MTKTGEIALRNMLNALRPADVKDYIWERAVHNLLTAFDYADKCSAATDEEFKQLYAQFAEERYQVAEALINNDQIHLISDEYVRYCEQLEQREPDAHTAEKVTEAYTVVKDYDGYDVAEKHYKTKYRLLQPWRQFKAGQTITWWEGRQCVGGYVSGHWQLA